MAAKSCIALVAEHDVFNSSFRLSLRSGLPILFAMVSAPAAAQCATGVDTGGGNCVPPDAPGMPGYSPAAPAPPAPVWADSWGAIALDTVDSAKGVTTGAASKRDAIEAAMDQCRSAGGGHCKIILSYYNQCAAVAWGENAYAVANNPTTDGAQSEALKECSKDGQKCKVVYSACSPARRVN
jgi:hypothetical protein